MHSPLDTVLCRLEDIPDGEGKGFDIEQGDDIVEIFVVRQGTTVHAYQNLCPHVGTPLNWVDDRFMTLALYAIDSLIMDRPRRWNFRLVELADFSPGICADVSRRRHCPICGGMSQALRRAGAPTPFPRVA